MKKHIDYYLVEDASVSLNVYNLWGNHVATLIDNENLKRGRISKTFDAHDIPDGIYLVKLTAGDNEVLKKVMKDK